MFLWFCSAKSGFGWLWFIRSILMEQLRFGSFEFRWYVSYRPSLLGSTARFKDCHLNVRWNDISVKLVLKHKSFLWFSMRSTNFFSLYEKMKGNPVGDWCSSLKRISISLLYNYTLIFLVIWWLLVAWQLLFLGLYLYTMRAVWWHGWASVASDKFKEQKT